MKQLLTVLLLLILAQAIGKPPEPNKKENESQRKQTKALMTEQIKQLKNGVLLVRLQTKANTIAALQKIGKNALAAKIKEDQLSFNKKIVAAFKKKFTFCPAYFFYSNYSEMILSGQLDAVVFLDDSLQTDPTIKLSSANFLTAEFGIISQDTSKKSTNTYHYDGENDLNRKSSYQSGADMNIGVLKIMSNQFVQLKRPFPFYVRTFDSFIIKRSVSNTVWLMNYKLMDFYGRNIDS